MARLVTFDGEEMFPVPGSMSVDYAGVDAGGGDVPLVRNALPAVLKFKLIPEAVYGAVTNPTVAELLALRLNTTTTGDTAAKDTTWEARGGSTDTIEESVLKVTLSGDGTQEADIEIRGNKGA